MSEYEEDKFMEQIEKWDAKHAKQDFLARMERKLNRKERFGR
jgi:hypothetical protein